jgi:hypothetical protein
MNAITANAMEKSKLGEASFCDLFSFPSLEEKICSDNTLSPTRKHARALHRENKIKVIISAQIKFSFCSCGVLLKPASSYTE